MGYFVTSFSWATCAWHSWAAHACVVPFTRLSVDTALVPPPLLHPWQGWGRKRLQGWEPDSSRVPRSETPQGHSSHGSPHSTGTSWPQACPSLPPPGHSQAPPFLWPVQDKPSALQLMRTPHPAALGLPPFLPTTLGAQRGSSMRGNPAPCLPWGSHALLSWCTCGMSPGALGLLSPYPSLSRVSFVPFPPKITHHVPVLQPSLSLSIQPFQQNSFPATHCPSSASTPLARCTAGAGLPLPEPP